MNIKLNIKNPHIRNIVIILCVGAVSFFLWYQFVYSGIISEINSLKKELAKKQEELNAIQVLKPQLKKLEKDIALANLKLDSLKSMFPDQKEIPKLLKEITAVAQASNISTTKFNPLPDIQREYYVENRYDLTVTGGYHDLAKFFSFLANMPLIINFSNVSIKVNPFLAQSKKDSEEHGTPITSIIASFQMTTFSSKK
jgi:type IV pilus assembly protein PilO